MQVDGGGGGLQRAHAVVVVVGVELLEMQDARNAWRGFAGYAHGAAGDGVVVGLGPAVGAEGIGYSTPKPSVQ